MRAHTRHAGGSARLDLSGRRRDAADFPGHGRDGAAAGASGIMLRNPDAMPVYGQVRVYAWEQRGGDDVLLPTDEIQVSPPSSRCGPAASSWCGWCARRGNRRRSRRAIGWSSTRFRIRPRRRSMAWCCGCAIRCRCSWPGHARAASAELEGGARGQGMGAEPEQHRHPLCAGGQPAGVGQRRQARGRGRRAGGLCAGPAPAAVAYPRPARRAPCVSGPDQWRHDLGYAQDGLSGRGRVARLGHRAGLVVHGGAGGGRARSAGVVRRYRRARRSWK